MQPSGTPRILDPWCWALGVAVGVAALVSCRVERDRADGGSGVHPAGYAVPASSDFHGPALVSTGYPLDECRECHGERYEGGSIAPSCVSSDCHRDGVEACGTCHGVGTDPDPGTDAHFAHPGCQTCHPSRADARDPGHPNGEVEITFTGLASQGNASPSYDAGSRTCSDVYCHGGRTIEWQPVAGGLGCDACHDAQPEWHAGFNDGAPSSCAGCHPASEHLDGSVQSLEIGCDGCHGSGKLGAPPPALDGSTDARSPGVGAHRRHLDSTLVDRIGKVVRCDQCHRVPAALHADHHLDPDGIAEVTVWDNGAYDPVEQRCVSSCHFNRDPGPRWTDDSGAELACDACHEAAPTKALDGSPHPITAPGPASCAGCHVFDPLTHVNGKVELL